VNRKRTAVEQPTPRATKLMKLNKDPPFDRFEISFLDDFVKE